MEVPPFLLWYLLIINLITLIVYGADKISAAAGSWRVRERTLYLLALVGGSAGALIAITLFRHKSRKASFLIILAVIFLVQFGAVLYLAHPHLDSLTSSSDLLR